MDKMLNILIPMAGAGSRFSKAGFELPKPLIMVHGSPMIKVVIDNLKPSLPHRFIFMCQKSHIEKYSIDKYLAEIEPNSIVVEVEGLTDGAACTVLLAKEFINNSEPLMIANCDQYINADINDYLEAINNHNLDASIMTMNSDEDKWSYVKLTDNLVTDVVEKQVVSNQATVGIYNYKRGSDFVAAAEKMISFNDRVNNEFYVAPAYNYIIADGKKVGFYNIGNASSGMYGLGVPEDLAFFCQDSISRFLIKN